MPANPPISKPTRADAIALNANVAVHTRLVLTSA